MRHDFRLTANQPQGPLAAGTTMVAQDMESIFGGASHRPAEPTADPVVPIAKADRAEPRSWFWPVTLIMTAALLIVAGTGWMALRTGVATHTAPNPAARAPAAAPARVAAAPAPATRPPATRSPQAPVVARAVVAPAIVAPAIVTPAAKPAASPSRPKAKAEPRRAAELRRVPASDGNILNDRFNNRIRASRLYPAMAAADRELREAYARAEYVGLNPKLLRMFRDRWWQVRKDVEPDPAYAIEAYYQLAREIDTARRKS